MRLAWALAAAMGASVCGETELQTMLHGERCAPRGGEQVTEANVLSYRRGAVLAGTSVLHRALVANRGWLMMAEKIPGVGDEPEYGGMFFERHVAIGLLVGQHTAMRLFAGYDSLQASDGYVARSTMKMQRRRFWTALIAPYDTISAQEIKASEKEEYISKGYMVRQEYRVEVDVRLEVGGRAFECEPLRVAGISVPGVSDTARVAFLMAATLGPVEDALRREEGRELIRKRWSEGELMRFARQVFDTGTMKR